MNANHHRNNLPRNLQCPHCNGQMNLTGRGKAPASVMYLCVQCVPILRTKELWLGQVVRTGNRDFGFVQLRGPHAMGGLRFEYCDFAAPRRGKSQATPRLGENVLVLLGDDARHAERVWRIDATAQPNRNGQGNSGNGTHRPSGNGRRRGSVTKLGGPDWGFVTEFGTGRELFVHCNDLRGGARLSLGRQVSYLPAQTPKGWKACEVE